MPVQGHGRFHPQRIPGSQTRRPDGRLGGAGVVGDQGHRLHGQGRRQDHLHAVFTCVAGARDEHVGAHQVQADEPEPLEVRDLGRHPTEKVDDPRSLKCQHRRTGGFVAPVEFELAAPGIEVLQVIVAHEAVSALAGGHAMNPPRADEVEEPPRIGPGEPQPAHVRDVEQAAAVAHLAMLLDDRVIQHGHLPAGELDQLRPVVHVEPVQRRAAQRFGRERGHGELLTGS